jgi:hypothetical protein
MKILEMNLENLNLVELNAQEVQETEGGWILKVILTWYLGSIANDPAESGNSFQEGRAFASQYI